MLFDSHSHTAFSADSEMQAEAAIEAAETKGIGLVFTEHLDFDFPGEEDFVFDPEQYWNAYESFRGETLRLGVEVGLEAAAHDRVPTFLQKAPFDLVIGSIHLLEHHDLYYKDYYAGKTKEEVFHRYFQTMAGEVRAFDAFDVLGHIDYIARYATYENPEIEYGVYHDDIDAVLRAVIETGRVLELNTRRLGERRALKELVPVYARYHELGGRYVTLGSDAHTPDAIGANFARARELAEQMGLSVVTFAGREMELCK